MENCLQFTTIPSRMIWCFVGAKGVIGERKEVISFVSEKFVKD